ncbi:TPR repeat containing protein [Achlya hypogyna]|uniref:TPR repeat containing protein n=1 Tax=Achlya hypogyna TaxID=1202772 RepID=A0A1V9Y9F2_ACHHY|nr:TPR repeat containing protein [Achlya hypogyna]
MAPQRPTGVKLAYFAYLIEHLGGHDQLRGLTTADVCLQHIVPLTAATQLSLVDHLRTDKATAHFVAEANWYISHAWSYLFLETVDSLETYFTGRHLADEVVVWFCVFNNNQHFGCVRPFSFWSSTFQTQLAAIGNVVMIMHPWNDPVVLRRSWCVFEVYVAIKVGARFEMTLATAQKDLFLKDIVNMNTFIKMLATIKSEDSDATIAADRDGIFELIRTEVSFEKLDQMVFQTISTWVHDTVRAHIAAMSTDPLTQAAYWAALGRLYKSKNDKADATDCFDRAYALYLAHSGPHHEETLAARSYGLSTRAIPNMPPADLAALEVQYNELLAQLRMHLGDTHALTEMTHMNLAFAYFSASDLRRAVDTFEDIYSCVTSNGCPNGDPMTLLNNIGTLYSMMHEYDKALPWQLQCLQRRREQLGPNDPRTIESVNNLGMLYKGMGNLSEAEDCLAPAAEYYKRVLGLKSDATWKCLLNLATVYLQQGRCRDARAVLELIWPHIQAEAPQTHLVVGTALFAWGLLHWTSMELATAATYFEEAFAWHLKHLGPAHLQTQKAADGCCLFAADPEVRAVPAPTVLALYKVATAPWLALRCIGCACAIVGDAHYCRVCPRNAFYFCDACVGVAKPASFCAHRSALHTVRPPCAFTDNLYTAYVAASEARNLHLFVEPRSWHPLM